jgi:hypothetical protein
MSQPTDITNLTDIKSGVADIVIDGTALEVTAGVTVGGRYWSLFTPDARLAGVVVEHASGFDAVIGTSPTHAATAQDAALLIVAAIHVATPKDAE